MDLLTPEIGLFVWTLIAFLLVLFILKKFAWKPILNTLSEREKGIADSIAAADRVKKEMAQLQSDNERLMHEAREERAALIKEAKEAKDKMINEAKAQAKVEADKVTAASLAQIEQQKTAAMTEIKNQIGMLSVEIAEKLLRQQLNNKEAQSAYAQQLVEAIKLN